MPQEKRKGTKTSISNISTSGRIAITDVCTMLHLNGTCEVLFG